jgi:serine/threonine protein kinase/formylglycine-generating enzyme required for sulfatase activity
MPRGKYEGSELDGRYELLRQLDEGSFGAVYEARDLKLGRGVAIKILFDQGEAAFRKEARLAVQFEHPNVVQVYDYGSDNSLNVGYIVMEFLRGRRLDQVITSLACRIPDSMIVRFVDQIGSALQLAHERQLIHRDLKPHNVMLVDEKTPQERFVLLDLGLASQMNTNSTLRNRTLDGAMSPRYASPEQLNSGEVGFRSDIYSFATMVYELFAGTNPFPCEELLGLMMAICQQPPPPFADVVPERPIPSGVEDILFQCLAKRPADRPASIGEVREAILREMSGNPADPNARSGYPFGAPPLSGTGTGSGFRQDANSQLSSHTIPPPASQSSPPLPHNTSVPPVSVATGSGRSDPTSGRAAAVAPASPEWKGRSKRDRAPGSMVWIVAAALIAVAGVGAVAGRQWLFRENSTDMVTQPAVRLVMASDIELASESNAALQLLVDPPISSSGESPEIRVEALGLPDWLSVTIPKTIAAAQLNQLMLHAGPVSDTRSVRIQVHVSAGDWTQIRDVDVTVSAPDVVKLPAGFTVATEAEIVRCEADGRRHYGRIVRALSTGLQSTFLLVEPSLLSHNRAGGGLPFYIMENEVSNELFAAFMTSEPGQALPASVKTEWQMGATAGKDSLSPSQHPRLPAVRVPPLVAHRFAIWLCGNAGHLPTVEQWDLAAGLGIHQLPEQPESARYPDGPFQGVWNSTSIDVAVNRRSLGPSAVGESRDDISLYGCRDMSGNVREMTETLMNGSRLGGIVDAAGNSLQRVVLRGHSYLNETPLLWSDLEEQSDIPDALGIDETEPSVGFRVVLEIPR